MSTHTNPSPRNAAIVGSVLFAGALIYWLSGPKVAPSEGSAPIARHRGEETKRGDANATMQKTVGDVRQKAGSASG
ncbi:hypothetical protein JAAARDRAFT_193322 [Jaapia argillacea MUCL 33604]|uniref:Uncharacterized protein n=1 Tax=Jaapia argillacea MUCL 33604 TaxID=933084 RepID=A0A067PVF2_9AGAM|nr:hypothetical protein JAAARDRAFT_193322 [Jaapia argillacea MUCL 33604]